MRGGGLLSILGHVGLQTACEELRLFKRKLTVDELKASTKEVVE
jgi:hypothetical protein